MATTTAFITLTLVACVMCAPQVIIKDSSTIRTPVNMSYEELRYIVQVRNGLPQTKPKLLTPCARAILGCCKGNEMNSNCSEALSCGAHFFDDNPCENKFVEDALEAAKSFYEQLNKKTS